MKFHLPTLFASAGLAVFSIFTASATDYVWSSGADGNWEDSSNWTPSVGYPSAAGDTATIPNPENAEGAGSAFTVTVNTPFEIAALSVGGTAGHEGKATLLIASGTATNKVSGNIVFGSGAVVTHYGPNDNVVAHAVVLQAGGDITIASGASVNVDQKGYLFVKNSSKHGGPGEGRDYGRYGGETSVYSAVGEVHGSIRRPVDYGASVYYIGANSPGAIHLIAGGTLTVNGEIRSCGTGGDVCGSSGGSIWLECGTLGGVGSILALGGGGSQSYCGSGGRISIVQRETSGWTGFTGTYDAGLDKNDGNATCGTIYLEDASDTADEGTLIVDNANRNKNSMTPLNFIMADATNAFGRVVVRNRGKLRIVPGLTMKVTKELSVASNGSVLTEEGGAIEFVGAEDATFTGGSLVTIDTLVCTNAGKTIRFGTAAADRITIPLGKNFIVRGEAGNPVTLASITDGTRWQLNVNANAANVDVANVAVKDSDASYGDSVTAIDSTDLGNNKYWGFSAPIVPGAAIVWTGAADTAWQNPANWSPARAPVATDVISIPVVASAKYPVLGAGTFVFNDIAVASGATLTLNGPTLTVTNSLAVAGALTASGAVDLYLTGSADFTGGTINPGSSRFFVTGSGGQTLDFGNCTLNKLFFQKPSGDVSFGAHGFTAESMQCAATTAIEFTFAAGATYTVADLTLSGASGGSQLISLKSSSPGTAWNLVATEDGQSVSGVSVSDSDASGGETIMAGTGSVGVSGNVNWDFVTDVAIWTGGTTGSFNSGSSWSTGRVPGADTAVVISAGDGETATATLPAGSPMTFKSLKAKAGAGGIAKFVADSPIVICDSIDIQANGVVELNAFDENGSAPNVVTNNVRIRAGGILSHTGPNDTESKKLHIRCLGTFTVDAGGAVDVKYKGYNYNKGPGCADRTPYHASTASHYAGHLGTAQCYGSIRKPFSYGSGCSGTAAGGFGSGAVKIEAMGTLVVNGTITAAEEDTSNVFRGSAGSVWIECRTLEGSGSILAHGANWPNMACISSSGGRVAVYQSEASDLSAYLGTIYTTGLTCKYSHCGTIYIEGSGDEPGRGTMIVDNRNVAADSYCTVFGELITDLDEPFGEVIVTNRARLKIYAGKTLRVTKGITCSSNSNIQSVDGTTAIEFCGTNDAVIVGAARVATGAFICTNVEKRIYFGTTANDKLSLGAGAALTLSGVDSAHPVSLLPLGGAGTWGLSVDADAAVNVEKVAVMNSDASSGASILAIDSTDLGGNAYWSFSSVIVPGERIIWTGATSTDWTDGSNWDLGRAPVETDDVLVRSAGSYDPTLASGTYLFNKVTIESNATLTLSGVALTVTNAMVNSGSLVFSDAETLNLLGDAFFTNGTVTAANSVVTIAGVGAQAINFDGKSLNTVIVDKPSGSLAFAGGGFNANYFSCIPTNALAISFAAGQLFSFDKCYLNGSAGGGRLLTLASTQSGTRWRLKVVEGAHGFGGLAVSDSDASVGDLAYAGLTSLNEGNNLNWDFSTDVAVWSGGVSGSWDDASNWSSGAIPGADTIVSIVVGDGVTTTVAVHSASAASAGSLTIGAGIGGSAIVIVDGSIAVSGNVTVQVGGTLVLNAYDDFGSAPNVVSNNLTVAAGGTITHSGPAASENAKIHLAVLGNMTVEEGGAVSATGKGYSGSNPAGASGGLMYGAAHAGYANGNNVTLEPYGSIFCPTNWGASPAQISGGGAVHLVVSGNLTVNGAIAADGDRNGFYGGCGGSVWVECAALLGSGTISAREGLTTYTAYAGSGGRVAVYQRAAKDFAAFPKSRILASDASPNSAGTVYLEAANSKEGSWLYIENGMAPSRYATKFPMAADGDVARRYANVNLIIGNGGWVMVARDSFNIPQRIRIRSLSLTSATSVLDLGANFLAVSDPSRRRDKDWAEGATVNVSEYNKVPGEIIWLESGFILLIR